MMKLSKAMIQTFVLCVSTITSMAQETKLKLTINGETQLSATLVSNSSTEALIALLKEKPLTIEMSDYGNMEKVGSIGTALPRNDEQITTEPGDIILYQGNALVIYYAPNTWNFTRLGKIDNITPDELKAILGEGSVTVKLELVDGTTNIEQPGNSEKPYDIYPNPAKNTFEVSGQFDKLTLLDLNGKHLFSTSKSKIDLSSLAKGTYLLKIEYKRDHPVLKKIVKG